MNTHTRRVVSSPLTLAGALLLSVAFAAMPMASLAQDAPANATETPANTTEAPANTTEAPANGTDTSGAQTAAPTAETVVARVGDDTITEADLAFAAEDLGQELSTIPPADQRAFLVTILIDMKVMAEAARAAALDQSPIFKERLQYLEERALRRAYLAEKISSAVTPESVQAAYDTFVASFTPEEEVRARHILVSSEEDAAAIKAELEAGAVFEDIAREKSMDPGGANGGDLGFFGRGMMVPEFEAAAFALTEPGQVSDPVQSQFGWHIIRLEEKRQSSPPTIEQMGPQLQQQILFESFDEAVAALKANTTIEIPDPELAAAVSQQSESSSGGAEPTP